MNDNPYQSPVGESLRIARPRPLRVNNVVVLITASVITLLFATINAIDEELPTLFATQVVLAAVVSQLPGVFVAMVYSRHPSRACIVLLLPAYIVAMTGLAAYYFYAFNGKADSLDSAAHIHVIVFPIIHCVFATLLYVAMLVPAGMIAAADRSKRSVNQRERFAD